MKNFSYFRNKKLIYDLLICMFVTSTFYGCYSFTGATRAKHLNTLKIEPVVDMSGYGSPKVKDNMIIYLIDKFRNDNTYNIVDKDGDASLKVQINSIRDETMVVNPGELEKERKISVNVEAEFYDNVMKKSIWKKSFNNFSVYDVQKALTNREEALMDALNRTSEDILIAVVSGW